MEKNIKDMTLEELEDLSYHDISVKKLQNQCNPFSAWMEIDSEIQKEEVLKCLELGLEEVVNTPLALDAYFDTGKPLNPLEARHNHIKKIAYFVKHGFDNPIDLDVGVPSMGCYPNHLIEDGNHRFAAAIIRGEKTIKATIMGEGEYAKELGLWKPNKYLKELVKRYDQDIEDVCTTFDEKSHNRLKI